MNEDEKQRLRDWLNYWKDTWLHGGRYNMDDWNCGDTQIRTNNPSESGNKRMNARIKKPHPDLFKFVEVIQEISADAMLAFERYNLHGVTNPRPQKQITKDEQINKALKNYYQDGADRGDLFLCLTRCSKAMHGAWDSLEASYEMQSTQLQNVSEIPEASREPEDNDPRRAPSQDADDAAAAQDEEHAVGSQEADEAEAERLLRKRRRRRRQDRDASDEPSSKRQRKNDEGGGPNEHQ